MYDAPKEAKLLVYADLYLIMRIWFGILRLEARGMIYIAGPK